MDYLEWAKNKWQHLGTKDDALTACLIVIAEELRKLNINMEIWTDLFAESKGYMVSRERKANDETQGHHLRQQ